MPDITANEIITLRHKRNFIQFGGARPGNPVKYSGQNAQYMAIDGLSMPESGGVDPIWVPDPRRIGQYRLVARSITPPDLANATLILRELHGSIPRQLTKIGCQFNLYELTGSCGDLSDFLAGWSDYVLVYSGAIVTDKDMGARSAWDSDDAIEDSLSITLSDVYPVGSLSFGEGAGNEVDREVVDIVYDSSISCGDCGAATDGASRIYAITKSSGAGSPGLPAELVYTLDGGATWTNVNITGMGANEDPVAIDIVGAYLLILAGTAAAPAYYYASINPLNGVPGSFTKVTTGLVANKQPVDIYVASPREIYLCGSGGYIYKSENLVQGFSVVNAGSATTNDLLRINGTENTIVTVGASGTVVKSVNRGRTWGVTTASPTASNVQAISVLDALRYWVGSAGGRLYYTLDGGESWTEYSFAFSGLGQIYDIAFPTGEVGYVSFTNATPTAGILTTFNGGADWTNGSPRILNMPTYNRANRIAYPAIDAGNAVNNVAIAGLAGNGTDGIILVGVAAKV